MKKVIIIVCNKSMKEEIRKKTRISIQDKNLVKTEKRNEKEEKVLGKQRKKDRE